METIGRFMFRTAAVVLAIAVGLGAFAVWRWSTDRLSGRPTLPTPTSAAVAATPILDARRLEAALTVWSEATRLGSEVSAIEVALADSSCAVIDDDGRRLVDIGDDTVVDAGAAQHLLIGATAIDLLGVDHRFVTEVRGPDPVDGVVGGDLYLIGGGDPMLFSGLALPLASGLGLPATVADQLVDQLLGRGIVAIGGDLIGVDDRYDQLFIAPELADRTPRPAPTAALVINRGLLVGATYALNPVQAAAAELGRLLAERGVGVAGRSRAVTTAPADLGRLAVVESAALGDIVRAMIEARDGDAADILLKEIGWQTTGRGSRTAGATAVGERGADPDRPPQIVEGSGRAAGNRLRCDDLLVATTRLADELGLTTFEYVETVGEQQVVIGVDSGTTMVVIGASPVDTGDVLGRLRIDGLEGLGPTTS